MWAMFKQTKMFDIQEDRKEYYENIVDKPLLLIGGIWVRNVSSEEPKLLVHPQSLVYNASPAIFGLEKAGII